jgi:hypothetical protein
MFGYLIILINNLSYNRLAKEVDWRGGDWVKTRLDFNISNWSWIHTTAWGFQLPGVWNIGTEHNSDVSIWINSNISRTWNPETCGHFGMIPLTMIPVRSHFSCRQDLDWSGGARLYLHFWELRTIDISCIEMTNGMMILPETSNIAVCTITYPEMSPRKKHSIVPVRSLVSSLRTMCINWLLVSTPLKNMSSSVWMILPNINGKLKNV